VINQLETVVETVEMKRIPNLKTLVTERRIILKRIKGQKKELNNEKTKNSIISSIRIAIKVLNQLTVDKQTLVQLRQDNTNSSSSTVEVTCSNNKPTTLVSNKTSKMVDGELHSKFLKMDFQIVD
jgi:phenylalanyl-tRNA synthetase alpha subunit